jgi:tetratricopeptide (TPR) repeat protein
MTLSGTIAGYPLLSEASGLMQDGQLERAAQATMAHLRRHPDEPRGLALLGRIAMLLGALGQSEHFLRRALARGDRDFETRRALATVLNQQERLDEARALFELLERESDDPLLPAARAQILTKLARHDEALSIQESLARANPATPSHWIAYGQSLRAAGRVDEAIEAYRKAVTVDFEYGEAWWGLAGIKQRVLTDDDIVQMREGLRIAIDARNSAPLHFALAKALHDRGQHAEAFAQYSEGNRQRA